MSKISEGGPQEIIYVPWDQQFLQDISSLVEIQDSLQVKADAIRISLKTVPNAVIDAVPQEQVEAELYALLDDPDAPRALDDEDVADTKITLLDDYAPSEVNGYARVKIDRVDFESIILASRLCHLDIGSFAYAATRYFVQTELANSRQK
jgi:hypothetical protein